MNMEIKNNDTLGFYMIKYMKEIATEKSMDMFSVWFVEKLIIPYRKEDNILQWISESLGFKKVPTIDKFYFRLKEINLIT